MHHGLTDPSYGGDGGHGLAGIPPGGGVYPPGGTHRRTHRQERFERQLVTLPTDGGVVSAEHGGGMLEPGCPPVPARDAGVGALFRVQPH